MSSHFSSVQPGLCLTTSLHCAFPNESSQCSHTRNRGCTISSPQTAKLSHQQAECMSSHFSIVQPGLCWTTFVQLGLCWTTFFHCWTTFSNLDSAGRGASLPFFSCPTHLTKVRVFLALFARFIASHHIPAALVTSAYYNTLHWIHLPTIHSLHLPTIHWIIDILSANIMPAHITSAYITHYTSTHCTLYRLHTFVKPHLIWVCTFCTGGASFCAGGARLTSDIISTHSFGSMLPIQGFASVSTLGRLCFETQKNNYNKILLMC